jgi:spermidine synthase
MQRMTINNPPNQKSEIRNPKLLLAIFFSGLVTLAVELAAFRLFAPTFGTTNLIAAVVIGLILLYLAAGYTIGGRWADRSPRAETLYRIIVWGAFLVGLIPFIAQPLLRIARDNLQNLANFNTALLIFAFLVTLILLSVPVTLLGCVSPFAIRLSIDDLTQSGRVAGRLYAISTAGSFIGSFLPELILLDWIGTRGTFVLLALILIAIGFIGLGRKSIGLVWMPIVLIALNGLLPVSISEIAGTIYQGESAYNYIQVVQRGDTRYLLLNEGQGIHSIYNPNSLQSSGTWDYFLLAPYFNPAPYSTQRLKRVAIVGLAGGTIARSYSTIFGPVPIDGIEIDPKIVDVGKKYFDMNESNLNVIIADGRAALANSPYHYNVVAIDAFRVPYIPWHLTTREYFLDVRDHLTSDGVLAINVGHTPDNHDLVDAIARTAQTVFPSVHVIDVSGSFNSIVYATIQPTSFSNLQANITDAQHPLVRSITQLALKNRHNFATSGVIFTDDKAPIEQMTNAIVLNFLFGLSSGEIKLP